MTPVESARRLVVKIGSSILVDETRGEIRRDWLETLTDDVARLHKGGCEVVLELPLRRARNPQKASLCAL